MEKNTTFRIGLEERLGRLLFPEPLQVPRRDRHAQTRPLRDEIEKWSINFTADEILEKVLADPGPGIIVFGPVNPPTKVLKEAHWWERGCFRTVADPVYGELLLQMPAWRMTRTPPRFKWACRPLGYHNAHVYSKYFGFGPGSLAELKRQGVL